MHVMCYTKDCALHLRPKMYKSIHWDHDYEYTHHMCDSRYVWSNLLHVMLILQSPVKNDDGMGCLNQEVRDEPSTSNMCTCVCVCVCVADTEAHVQ